MPSPWRGQFSDGLTAAVHPVALTVEDGALVGRAPEDGGERLRWPLPRLGVHPPVAGQVTVTCSDAPDAVLTTDVETIEAHADLLQPGAARRAVGRWRAIAAYAAGAAAIVALFYLNLDPLARAIARRIPPSYEAELGRGLGTIIERQFCETPAATAALTRLARRLDGADAAGLHVMDTPLVNAFTFPGGAVVITRGLIEQAHSSDELAGVLAHELEHVRRRHVMVHVVRGSVLTALWQATVGDYSGLFVVDPKTALDIASLRFSRDDEREADRGALARLDAAGISRAGFRAFFDRMRAETDAIPPWLSNHPASAERIAAIQDEVGALPRTPATSSTDWDAIKHGCAAKAR